MMTYELTETEMCALAFVQGQQMLLAQQQKNLNEQAGKIYADIESRLGVPKLFDDSTGQVRLEGKKLHKQEKASKPKAKASK
jgi:hypothetical protein